MKTNRSLRRPAPYILLVIVTILAFQPVASAWLNPGTRTPGYWMNHPEAWPSDLIGIGAIVYTKADAIYLMKLPVAGDKTLSLFPALVAAELNVQLDNEVYCILDALAAAQAWLAENQVGTGVRANSEEWQEIAPAFCLLGQYNSGKLCAPPADD